MNLRNKQYYIFNEQYPKEEYFKKLEEYSLDSYEGISKLKELADDFKYKHIEKYIHGYRNNKVSGDYVFNSKNSFYVYDSEEMEDCKHIIHGNKVKDCYDGYVVVDNSESSLETVSSITLNNVKFSYCVWNDHDVEYCDTCENSNNLFGCVGLRKNQYCILNKQYTKEEYEELVPKIIQHMKDMPYIDNKGRKYRYGEFFPSELSAFAYNETAAQEYSPLTKEQAIEQGFKWKESADRDIHPTIKSADLPNSIKDVKDNVTEEIIECMHKECSCRCTNAFKITAAELEFHRKLNLPLPRLCPNCRHFQRVKQRNPLKLYRRKCQCNEDNIKYTNITEHAHGKESCPNEFETTYAPDKKETIYCEDCYKREVG